MNDNWVRDWPNPIIPHEVRRKRRTMTAIWAIFGIFAVLASIEMVLWAAPYVGEIVYRLAGE